MFWLIFVSLLIIKSKTMNFKEIAQNLLDCEFVDIQRISFENFTAEHRFTPIQGLVFMLAQFTIMMKLVTVLPTTMTNKALLNVSLMPLNKFFNLQTLRQ
jgi:hypothetical protein